MYKNEIVGLLQRTPSDAYVKLGCPVCRSINSEEEFQSTTLSASSSTGHGDLVPRRRRSQLPPILGVYETIHYNTTCVPSEAALLSRLNQESSLLAKELAIPCKNEQQVVVLDVELFLYMAIMKDSQAI